MSGPGSMRPVEPTEPGGLSFTAPCPAGHPDAGWTTVLRTVVGESSDDYLGAQLPRYLVRCARCDGDAPT